MGLSTGIRTLYETTELLIKLLLNI